MNIKTFDTSYVTSHDVTIDINDPQQRKIIMDRNDSLHKMLKQNFN